MTTFLRPMTKEAENVYTEHASITTLYDREVKKNRQLTIFNKMLSFSWLIVFCARFLLFVVGFRADRFFYSECVSYPKLPIPVQTK